MPYVQRDGNNAVCGLYANAQEGYAEEYLPDDNGEVVAYLNPSVDPPLPTVGPPSVARLDVADGDVQSVTADSGISFAFAVDTNVFQVYFAASKPNGYTWSVNSTSGSAKVTDPQADYVEITVTDPTEPYSLSIQIFTVS